MGVSAGLVYLSSHPSRIYGLRLFGIQLFFNFAWSILFFYLENPLLGLVDILILDMLVVLYIIRIYPVSKWAGYLFIPYLLWILFATYLNMYIAYYN